MIKGEVKAKHTLIKNSIIFIVSLILFITVVFLTSSSKVSASSINVDISSGEADNVSSVLDMLFLLAFLAIIPSLLLVMTSFTRIVISLSFLRNALGTQNSPPNQVIVGLSLFMTIFIMLPVFIEIKDTAYMPYKEAKITQEEAIDNGIKPLKVFMLKQIYDKDLQLFLSLADEREMLNENDYTDKEKLTELSLVVIIPSFITSELKRAFIIGFLIYIPFLILDLVVSSTLMSMGMMMLPPAMISLPFKLLLFILVDGWNLLIQSLIVSFH